MAKSILSMLVLSLKTPIGLVLLLTSLNLLSIAFVVLVAIRYFTHSIFKDFLKDSIGIPAYKSVLVFGL